MKIYLDRDKVIDAIEQEFGGDTSPECIRAKEAVYSVESADVAPVVHGHWKRKTRRFINKETGAVQAHYIWNECSLCRKHNQCKTDFCPHCGAEMDESEE